MSEQSINLENVSIAISGLRTANENINNAFRAVETAAKRLDSNWNSRAGSLANTSMYQLLENNTARSTILQNYVNLLEQQVNPGYRSAEETNIKLADQFK